MGKTQKELVLRHLQTNGSITSMQAFWEYNITRLAAVIFKLRADGWNIVAHDELCINGEGNRVTYARYELVVDENGNI